MVKKTDGSNSIDPSLLEQAEELEKQVFSAVDLPEEYETSRVNSLKAKDQLIYVYSVKFLHDQLTLQPIGKLIEVALLMSASYKIGASRYLYSDSEQYGEVFNGVPVEEVDRIRDEFLTPPRDPHLEHFWPSVETLTTFTFITKEAPGTIFEVRWILAGGVL